MSTSARFPSRNAPSRDAPAVTAGRNVVDRVVNATVIATVAGETFMTAKKRIIKHIGISQAWLDLLFLRRPDLDGHGAAWAIESAIADLIGLRRPMTPTEARLRGAKTRGEQLRHRPALNPTGRGRKKIN